MLLRHLLFAVPFFTCSAFAQSVTPLPEPLTLGAALEALDAGHPTIAVAQADLSASRAELKIAKSAYHPKLKLDARYRQLDAYDPTEDQFVDDSHANLLLSQKITDFGRSSANISAKQALLSGTEHQLLDTRQQQQIVVMRRYFDVLLSDLSYIEANEAMSVAYVSMDKARDRLEMGQISDLELLDAERNYQQSRMTLHKSQANQRLTRVRLAASINRPSELSSDLVRPVMPQRDPLPLEELTEKALQFSPHLNQLRENLNAARATTESARSERWPTLRGEIEGSSYNREFGGRVGPLSASLILEVPLFDTSINARIARQQAEITRHSAILANAEMQTREQLTELWLQLETLKSRLEELEVLASYQELYLDRSRALYDLEVTANLGDAMTKTSAVRVQQASAEFDLAITWAQIDALTGNLTTSSSTMQKKQP